MFEIWGAWAQEQTKVEARLALLSLRMQSLKLFWPGIAEFDQVWSEEGPEHAGGGAAPAAAAVRCPDTPHSEHDPDI